mmetsp:Transcript_35289/g.64694  ORF Transcript_35289/g.64694 Transcript_35289/m.64694 type:complete len:94 (+) Transcript_35289:326-607(+)
MWLKSADIGKTYHSPPNQPIMESTALPFKLHRSIGTTAVGAGFAEPVLVLIDPLVSQLSLSLFYTFSTYQIVCDGSAEVLDMVAVQLLFFLSR